MNIQGSSSGPDRARQSYEDRQRALIDANRALVRAARDVMIRQRVADAARAREERTSSADETRQVTRDEIHLTAADGDANQPSPAEREAHVRELAEAHRMERLHTPERIERAAQRLLEG